MINHSPEKLNEIIGQDTSKILKFLDGSRKNALLIHGPTGTGKTSSVYALAKEKDYEILELNSSNFRKKDHIRSIVGEASQQQSLFFKKRLILIDEVDGISGRYDYGGLAELSKVIDKSKNPIILTANDVSNSKFKTLRRKCELLEFNHVDYLEIFSLLKKICEKEKVKFEESELKNLARKNNGDVRASILDLERSIIDKKISEEGDLREYGQNIEEALRIVFKSKDVKVLLGVFNNLSENLDEIFMWIEENLPKEYGEEDLKKAFDSLSRADVYKGRILRRQYYRLMVYQNALMGVGVGVSKVEKNPGFVSYSRSGRILKMWIAKNRNAKRRGIAEKFAKKTHTSIYKTGREFELLVNFLKSDEVVNELELDDDEIQFLRR
jgi:replication factor C large subunit